MENGRWKSCSRHCRIDFFIKSWYNTVNFIGQFETILS